MMRRHFPVGGDALEEYLLVAEENDRGTEDRVDAQVGQLDCGKGG